MTQDTLEAVAPASPLSAISPCEDVINENIAKNLPVNDRDYAIIVGINHYKSLHALEGPITDACAFRNWLISADGGNLLPEHCFFITSKEDDDTPDQQKIDLALSEVFRMAEKQPGRRLYFYFSGHGFGASWDVNGMCLPIWSERFYNAALSSKAYFDLLMEQDLFEEIYFFLDCCRERKINTKPLHSMLGGKGIGGGKAMAVVMYAAEYENPAREGITISEGNMSVRGYFSRALIEAFKGLAADEHGKTSMLQFENYVRSKTEAYAHEQQHVQTVRTDVRNSSNNLDFIIVQHRNLDVITSTALTIRFKQAGTYRLESPNLDILREDTANAGDTWQFNLTKGLYGISDGTVQGSKPIKIDLSRKTMEYEY
ncbi:caspase family protein [Chitinophaga tropicalis]|uniref:Peptidase C14 caspase domain-containing protein n=1 Tax=Chitinophaga tropicalis TaxID=2683588 RepID=A0A7K1U5Q8_9BACT|nr:caspase family protein [Chitinophaga tropicalis]MVT09703.1 hypothetical protein [Chitinophaga tropicalis]